MIKFSELEAQSSQPDTFPKLIAYAQLLQQQPAPKKRIALVEKLNDITNSSNLAVQSQLAIAKVLLHAINPSLPSNKQMSTSQIKSALEALRMQTAQTLRDFSTVTYLYTYQSLSNDELTQYINLYQSPEGQWATATGYNAVLRALEDAIEHFQQSAFLPKSPDFFRFSAVDFTYSF